MGVRELLDRVLETVNGNQAELARRLGRSETTISRWVTGRNGIDYESALRIARMTGLPAPDVLTACGLDPELLPVRAVADADIDPLTAELNQRLERYAALLSRLPRAVWLAVVEANEKMATAFDAVPDSSSPVRASGQGRVRAPKPGLNKGRRESDGTLADYTHPFGERAPVLAFAAPAAR